MLVIGHRGASVAAAENTVQAFVLADAMGADGVELDVRLAPDGRLLVKHDPLPADLDDLEGYPELREVLAVCGEMLVNVEIKNSADELGRDAVRTMSRNRPGHRNGIFSDGSNCRSHRPDRFGRSHCCASG